MNEKVTAPGILLPRPRRVCLQLCQMLCLQLCLLMCLMLAGCSVTPGIETGGSVESAEDLLAAGDYQEAAAAYEALIEAGEDTESNYRYLGIAYMGAGDYESAESALRCALDAAGIVPSAMEYDINYYLGVCCYKQGQYEEALEIFDAIVALRPSDADALMLRGTVCLQLEDTEGMLRDYDAAIALEPTDYDRLISIYEILSENGHETEGLQYLQDALAQYGDSMSSYDLGRVSYYAGDFETARTALEQLQNDLDYNVVLMLGRTYEALGDFNYATNVYRTFLSSDTSHAEVYNQLGLCCMKMEDYSGALEAFQSGKSSTSGELLQSLSFNEIIACEYLEDFDQAKTLMEAYIEAYPGDAAARREYIFLSSR